jgi:NADPH:quinone reductase-like Zn-dependent oxidoreductase
MKRVTIGLLCLAAGLVAQPAVGAETMLAVRISEYGSTDVLRLEQIPRPAPAQGQLLLRVHAAGVNPVDAHIRGGHTQGFIDVTLPHTPGFDVSGVVAAVGPGVEAFAVGDEVFAMLDLRRGGAYAEYAIVGVDEAARKPQRLSHVEAAALPLVSLTAWQAMFDTAGLSAGQTILIHGGSGGVGSVAIQLAKARDARVITTASKENHEFARSLGADVVVDYRTERFEDAARDVDVVFDLIGGQTQERSLAVLKDGGMLVSLVGLGRAAASPPRGIRASSILVRPDVEQLGRVAALVDAGRLQPIVSSALSLPQAADAHRQVETGHTRGKIVLAVVE